MFAAMSRSGDYRPSAVKQLLRRSFLEREGIAFYNGILHEDELFTFSAMMRAKAVAHRKKAYYLRRVRNDSIMTKGKRYANFKGYFVSFVEMFKYAAGNELEREAEPWVWNRVIGMRKTAFQLYSQLPQNEKRGIDWTEDPLTKALFEMSEYENWMGQKRAAEGIKRQLEIAQKGFIRGRMLPMIRRGVQCLKEKGVKYTIKKAIRKVYSWGKRVMRKLDKHACMRPVTRGLRKMRNMVRRAVKGK